MKSKNEKQAQTQKEDDNMAVFAVPSNKPFVITKEEAEKMLKNERKTPLTREEREKIHQNAERCRRKPEKNNNI